MSIDVCYGQRIENGNGVYKMMKKRKEKKFWKVKLITIRWAMMTAIKISPIIFFTWFIVSLLMSLLPALTLYYYRRIISQLSDYISIGQGNYQDCFFFAIILGVLLILNGLSNRINSKFLYMAMYDYYHLGLQEKIMESAQKVDLKAFRIKEYLDEYNYALGQAGSLTEFMSSTCILLSKVIGILSLLIVAAQTSIGICIFALIYLTIVVIVNLILANRTRVDILKVKEAERRIDNIERKVMVSGVAKEIRIYNTKDQIYHEWENDYDELDRINYRVEFWKEFISFISGLLFYAFIIIAMVYNLVQVKNGKIDMEDFLAIFILGQNLTNSISILTSRIQKIDRSLFTLERQYSFIHSISENVEDKSQSVSYESTSDVVFSAKNLCFSYDDEKEVLHNLNFEIKKGETISLVGNNGSGKSTLVKLLIKQYSPSKGELYFYGKSYDEYKTEDMISKIGVYFQQFALYHATLRENVGFGNIDEINNEDRVLDAINKGGATSLIHKLKDGLENWLLNYVYKDGANLSGGEKQKVGVSRAFMNDKHVMIFDEPASALDPIAEMEQFYKIKELMKEKTSILISHRVGFARLVDRIIVLDHGCIVEQGTHEELMERKGKYYHYFNEQAKWYDQTVFDKKAEAEENR